MSNTDIATRIADEIAACGIASILVPLSTRRWDELGVSYRNPTMLANVEKTCCLRGSTEVGPQPATPFTIVVPEYQKPS